MSENNNKNIEEQDVVVEEQDKVEEPVEAKDDAVEEVSAEKDGETAAAKDEKKKNVFLVWLAAAGAWFAKLGQIIAGFFKKLGQKIAELWNKLSAKLGKRNLIIICSAIAAVLIAVIVTVSVVCSNNNKDKDNGEQVTTTYSEGLAFNETADGTGYEISGMGTCTDRDLVLPVEYNGKSVTAIGNRSFMFNENVTSVTISKSVTRIGDYTFCNCKKLKTIIYNGTKAEWAAITKGNNWDYGLTGAVVKCTDETTSYVSTATASQGLTFELNADSTGYIVTGEGTCEDDVILIPAEYEGKPVVEIKANAFCIRNGETDYSASDLVAIAIPDSVTKIGEQAFALCSSLEKVSLSQSLVSIGETAFYGTTSLKQISFPSSLRTIGMFAFAHSGLTEVVIPEGVTTLGNGAFAWNESLTSATLPTTITDFDDVREDDDDADMFGTFYGCSALSEVILPDGMTKLGKQMFAQCESLTEITIPSGVTEIPDYLFTMASVDYRVKFKSLTLPSTLTKIGQFAFRNCDIDDIYFGGTVEQWKAVLTEAKLIGLINVFDSNACYVAHCADGNYIDTDTYVNGIHNACTSDGKGEGTFIYNGINSEGEGCGKIVIPSIGYLAGSSMSCRLASTCEGTFIGNKTLTVVAIPSAIKELGKSAFACCENLSRILYDGTTEQWNNLTKGDNWDYGTGEYTVYCTDGTVEKVATSVKYSQEQDLIIENSTVKGIRTSCTDKVIYIPNYISQIAAEAFQDDGKILGVIIPDSVEGMGNKVFKNCSNLKYVELGKEVTTIDDYAFYGTRSLKHISLPSSLTKIGKLAFSNSGLTEVVIPENVETLGYATFSYCKNLKSVTIQSTSIEDFGDGEDADIVGTFYGCEALEEVVLPEGMTKLGKQMFGGCTNLTKVTIPSSINVIAETAFTYCTGLSEVTFSDSLIQIGIYAFNNCRNLTDINFNGTMEQWKTVISNSNNMWNYSAGNYTVHCSDGTLDKDGRVIE